jgi:hypothetical protein
MLKKRTATQGVAVLRSVHHKTGPLVLHRSRVASSANLRTTLARRSHCLLPPLPRDCGGHQRIEKTDARAFYGLVPLRQYISTCFLPHFQVPVIAL